MVAFPGLVIYLDFVQHWPRLLNDRATHPFWTPGSVADPYILVLVKRLQGAVTGLEQLLGDFPRNIRLNQVQPCLEISTQEKLCRANLINDMGR